MAPRKPRKHVGSASRRSRAAAPTGASASAQAAAFPARGGGEVPGAPPRATLSVGAFGDVLEPGRPQVKRLERFRDERLGVVQERVAERQPARERVCLRLGERHDVRAHRLCRRRRESRAAPAPTLASALERVLEILRRATPSRVSSIHAAPAASAASRNARRARTRVIASSAATADARRGVPSAVTVSSPSASPPRGFAFGFVESRRGIEDASSPFTRVRVRVPVPPGRTSGAERRGGHLEVVHARPGGDRRGERRGAARPLSRSAAFAAPSRARATSRAVSRAARATRHTACTRASSRGTRRLSAREPRPSRA